MRINGHAHIFNLRTVLTPHAVKVMTNRVRALGVPEFVADAVEKFLAEQVLRPEYLVEEELLARFLTLIRQSAAFREFARTTAGLPVEVRLLGDGLPALETAALRATLDRLSSWFDDGADSKTTIADVFDTLRLAMRPSITAVAAEVLRSVEPDGGVVALMMDITSEDTAAQDRDRYLAQLKGTADAAAAFPGRIFPFVAVSTRRPDHFALMRKAIEELGFVGVKLYPSLGTRVDSADMLRVYDYCVEHDVPVLLHATRTGFYESDATTGFGDPALWEPILDARPGLRVCFAHSGGLAQGVLTPDGPQPRQWPHTIVELMRSFDEVYTDLSYHTDQMAGVEEEALYLAWLRRLLAEPGVGDRVMFGTDIRLVRLSLADAHYWRWFESRLTAAEMKRIAEDAPRRFLGLPDANGAGMRANMRRLADRLAALPAVGGEPAAWLRDAAGTAFNVQRVDPEWTKSNHAHVLTHAFFKRFMKSVHKRLAFADAGALRLRQLTYWNKEHVPETVFRNDCRAVALALVSLARGSGGAFEGSYDATSAVDRLAEVVADGEKTIAVAAGSVDAIFRFPTEAA